MISRGTFTEQINLKEENVLYPKEGGKPFPQFVSALPSAWLQIWLFEEAPWLILAVMPAAHRKQSEDPKDGVIGP